MGDLERRLVEQFDSHERTAGAVLPDGADPQAVLLQKSEAQYAAVKQALVEIARAIDQLSDGRVLDSERVAELDQRLESVGADKRSGKKKKKKGRP